jgi:hypothetical protein
MKGRRVGACGDVFRERVIAGASTGSCTTP